MGLGTRWQLGADTAVGLEATRDVAGGGESSDAQLHKFLFEHAFAT